MMYRRLGRDSSNSFRFVQFVITCYDVPRQLVQGACGHLLWYPGAVNSQRLPEQRRKSRTVCTRRRDPRAVLHDHAVAMEPRLATPRSVRPARKENLPGGRHLLCGANRQGSTLAAGALDQAAAEHSFALINHEGLSRGDRRHRFVECELDLVAVYADDLCFRRR
jgi:hypothetical protein